MKTNLTVFHLIAALNVSAVLVLSGCAAPTRLQAVPQDQTLKAEIPGMPGVRYVVPDGLAGFLPDALRVAAAEQKFRASAGMTGPLPPANFLAISMWLYLLISFISP